MIDRGSTPDVVQATPRARGRGLRRLALALAVAVSGVALAACGGDDDGAATAATTELQLAVYTAQDTTHGRAIDWWTEEVAELTDGQVEVDAHFSAALIPAEDTRDAVADGRVDLGYMSPAYTIDDFPLTMVAEMPFVSTHMPAHMMTIKELYENHDDVRQEWEGQGLHILAVLPVTNNTFAFREPVDSIDDLEGLSIRGIGRSSLLLDKIGANPRDIPYPEVYESLQRGVVDAASGVAYESTAFDNFYEVAPQIVGANIGGLGINALVVGTTTWDGFPADVQEGLTQASDGLMERMAEFQADADEETCEAITDAGGTVSHFSDADTARWEQEADDVVFEDWREDAERAIDDPDAFRDTYIDTLRNQEAELGEYLTGPETC